MRPFTILIVGGSQGAQGLNRVVVDAIAALSDEERSKIAVTHITGKRDQPWVAERYAQMSFSCDVLPFFSAMDQLFSRADLAITRAGANTLFELAAFGIPALVIPYPHAGGHQAYNAENFSENGGLVFHAEDSTAQSWLVERLHHYIENPETLAGLAKAMKRLGRPQATEKLVGIARKLIEDHEDRKR
jgi:UDP-N-acetylglucosamine--N-acetylmuramyl-(pentapeptide) pyrophosphoryl-undecaprenol N-acetylglucosamine transferase